MALSAEAQALFDHAMQSLPRWLTRGKNAALEWLYSYTEIFDASRVQGQSWLDITYIQNATGAELDQHAADRGITRRAGETDTTLRTRIVQVTDAVTDPALRAAINTILAASGLGTCALVCLRRDRAHYSRAAYFSRGYRMTVAQLPQKYIIILPFGTTAQIGAAVSDYLRQFGPGGFGTIVEIRGVP